METEWPVCAEYSDDSAFTLDQKCFWKRCALVPVPSREPSDRDGVVLRIY